MTQQVIRGRTTLVSTVATVDNVSIDFVFEATGSNPNIDFTVEQNPNVTVQAFFNNPLPSTMKIAQYISTDMSRAAGATYTTWTDITAHLDGSPAGSPFRQDNWTLAPAPAGTPLPGDVAVVCSYRADYGSVPEHGPQEELPTPDDAIDYGAPPTHLGNIRPRARMRSRFYVGPLMSPNILAASGGMLLPAAITDFGNALKQVLAVFNEGSADQFNAVVWSRRDAAVHSPTHYFVSEGFGTVRKRADVSVNRVHSWLPLS